MSSTMMWVLLLVLLLTLEGGAASAVTTIVTALIDSSWASRSREPSGDNVTELFGSWLKVTSDDAPKNVRSEPTADLW